MSFPDLDRVAVEAPASGAVAAVLETVYQIYGHDFRRYSFGSMSRRLRQLMAKTGLATTDEVRRRVEADPAFCETMLGALTVNVTELFRDPLLSAGLRREVFPYLRTYPRRTLWVAGCATGEEAYSLAILLREEGLDDNTIIYATDVNPWCIARAREGIFAVELLRQAGENYLRAGGRRSWSSYFTVAHGHAAIDPSLKKLIHFEPHNLVVDRAFAEMQVILCRNVIIYFESQLQRDTIALLSSSLVHGGFLCLGPQETLRATRSASAFEEVDPVARIYRKRLP